MSTIKVNNIEDVKTLTIGDATAEDTKIVFDGNAQDFHIGLDDSADSLTIGLGSTLGTTSHMVIDANGHITKPLQPAFLATLSGTQSAMAVGSAVTIQYVTEIYDQNADYNNSAYTFTAPVTGKYLLNFSAYGMTLDSAATYYESYLNTSNRNYYSTIDPDYGQDNAYHTFAVTALADMDANDTVLVKIYQSGGSSQTTFGGGSHFSGYLVC